MRLAKTLSFVDIDSTAAILFDDTTEDLPNGTHCFEWYGKGRVDKRAVGICVAVGGVCHKMIRVRLELFGDAELGCFYHIVPSRYDEAEVCYLLECEYRA